MWAQRQGAGTRRAGNAKAEDPAPANKKAALATGHSAKVPTAAPDLPSFRLLFFGKWEVQRDTLPLWEGVEMEGRRGDLQVISELLSPRFTQSSGPQAAEQRD